MVLRQKQWYCSFIWSLISLPYDKKKSKSQKIPTNKYFTNFNKKKIQPLHSSIAGQNVELHHGKAAPKGHSGHHAKACVDIFFDLIRPSLCPPRNLVQIP